MKKFFTTFFTLLFVGAPFLMAQLVPQGINYQCIVRDAMGEVVPDSDVALVFHIVADGPDGPIEYSEQVEVTTNSFGLINHVIGEGVPVGSDFSAIDWSEGNKWLRVLLNVSPQLVLLGSHKLQSVPYALYSDQVNNNNVEPDWDNIQNVPPDLDVDDTDDFSGDWNDLTNVPPGFADGVDDGGGSGAVADGVTIIGDGTAGSPFTVNEEEINVSWGNIVGVPADLADGDDVEDADADPMNELQSWDNLPGIPANIDTDASDDFSGSYDDLTDIPADLADGDDVEDADADPMNELQTWDNLPGIPANIDTDATDDFSGDWNDLTNVPPGFADGVDDSDGTTAIADGVTITGAGTGGDPFTVNDAAINPNWNNLTNVPANLDTDATDDFSGSYNDLTDIPADLADGDDVEDADSDPMNELQTWDNLPGIPANIDTDATDDFSGSYNDLTDIPGDLADGDDVEDADSDPMNELQTWDNLPGIPANIDTDATDDFSGSYDDLTDIPADLADGDDVEDADSDPMNELQTWDNLPGIPANIDTDATDDFSGDWNDLTNIPPGFADGVDDSDGSTAVADGITITGDGSGGDPFTVNDAEINPSWNNLTDVPANLDTDATDDFSGDWNDLDNIPANIDTDATDDFSGDWNDLDNVPVGFADGIDNVDDGDSNPTNELQSWNNLPGIPNNIDIDATDDFSGSWNDLTDVPAGFADGVDDSGGATAVADGVTITGVGTGGDPFTVNDSEINPNWNNLTNVPANLDTDATDDFSGSWNDLTSVPSGFSDGIDNTVDGDADDSNELQLLDYNAGTGLLSLLPSGGSVNLPTGGGNSLWSNCGSGIIYSNDVRIGNCGSIGLPESSYRASLNTNDEKGMYIEASPNGGETTAARLRAVGGSAANDGILLYSRAANNDATGMTLAVNEAQGAQGDVMGLKIYAGGSESDLFIQGDPNSSDQNYGIYIDLEDAQGGSRSPITGLTDIGLYVTADNVSNDFAALFDGDVGFIHEAEFFNTSGDQWSLGMFSSQDLKLRFNSNFDIGFFDHTDGAYFNLSDKRFKKRVSSLKGLLSSIRQLRPVSYHFEHDHNKETKLGFIAQEVEELFPELVNRVANKEYDEILTLNYDGFGVLAIQAIQEQQEIIDQQQSTIDALEARISSQSTRQSEMERELAELKAMVQAMSVQITKGD